MRGQGVFLLLLLPGMGVIPPGRRREDGGLLLLPDFDYATNIRATGEFYHTSTAEKKKIFIRRHGKKNQYASERLPPPTHDAKDPDMSSTSQLLLFSREATLVRYGSLAFHTVRKSHKTMRGCCTAADNTRHNKKK